MFDPNADAQLVPVLGSLDFVHHAPDFAGALVGEVLRLRRFAVNQPFLAGICVNDPYPNYLLEISGGRHYY